MIFDTHLHLVYRDKLRYSWLKDVPALDRDSTFEPYQRTAKRLGITGALHMEVDANTEDMAAETAMIESIMGRSDGLLRGAIAACRPESDSFAEYLETNRQHEAIKGFRRVLHVQPDALSTTSLFRDNVKRLSGTGLSFDLCVLPSQLTLAIELIDHCPDVTFVIDHCGVPDVKARALHPWSELMTNVAQRPNTIGKISGVMAYGDLDNWTLEDLRPFVEHTINAFGWDRVIWGSDSPVCTLGGTLETWVAATHMLIADCSADEKRALLSGNAQRLWSL